MRGRRDLDSAIATTEGINKKLLQSNYNAAYDYR